MQHLAAVRESSREKTIILPIYFAVTKRGSGGKKEKEAGKKGNKKVERGRGGMRVRVAASREESARSTGRPKRIRVLIFSATVINQRTNLFL